MPGECFIEFIIVFVTIFLYFLIWLNIFPFNGASFIIYLNLIAALFTVCCRFNSFLLSQTRFFFWSPDSNEAKDFLCRKEIWKIKRLCRVGVDWNVMSLSGWLNLHNLQRNLLSHDIKNELPKIKIKATKNQHESDKWNCATKDVDLDEAQSGTKIDFKTFLSISHHAILSLLFHLIESKQRNQLYVVGGYEINCIIKNRFKCMK